MYHIFLVRLRNLINFSLTNINSLRTSSAIRNPTLRDLNWCRGLSEYKTEKKHFTRFSPLIALNTNIKYSYSWTVFLAIVLLS